MNTTRLPRQPSARRGFTLVELMVVMLILGVLVALGIGVGYGIVTAAQKQQTTMTLKVIRQAIEGYYEGSKATTYIDANMGQYDSDHYPPNWDEQAGLLPNDGTTHHWDIIESCKWLAVWLYGLNLTTPATYVGGNWRINGDTTRQMTPPVRMAVDRLAQLPSGSLATVGGTDGNIQITKITFINRGPFLDAWGHVLRYSKYGGSGGTVKDNRPMPVPAGQTPTPTAGTPVVISAGCDYWSGRFGSYDQIATNYDPKNFNGYPITNSDPNVDGFDSTMTTTSANMRSDGP